MKPMIVVALLLTLGPAPGAFQARDTPPPVIENARRERELRASIAAGTATKEVYIELAGLMNRQNRFDDVIEAMRGAAALEPASAEAQHRIAVLFWDKSRGDPSLDPALKASYVQQGLEAEDRALALQPDYLEAITYKSILLRLKANASADPIEQKRLIDEADALRNRALELQRARQPAASTRPAEVSGDVAPFAGFSEPFEQAMARLQPVRVGGNIRTPTKVKDMRPEYPPVAQSARVQGVVIIEAVIDESGNVTNARVVRSIPLLDAAALDAVSQWQFTPTEVNGRRGAGDYDGHRELHVAVGCKKTLMSQEPAGARDGHGGRGDAGRSAAACPAAACPAARQRRRSAAAAAPDAAAAGVQGGHQPGSRRRHRARSQGGAGHRSDEGRLRGPRGRRPAERRDHETGRGQRRRAGRRHLAARSGRRSTPRSRLRATTSGCS